MVRVHDSGQADKRTDLRAGGGGAADGVGCRVDAVGRGVVARVDGAVAAAS